MQEKRILVLFLVLIGFVSTGFATSKRETQPQPPTLFVNEFFANCFEQGLGTDLEWRSIVDFIIFHTSWFINSDVGSCAANNPDVIDEANCWKRAFEQLLLDGSNALDVARTCVDLFVNVTRGGAVRTASGRGRHRPQISPYPFSSNEALNSRLCPPVDNDEFAQEVSNKVNASMVSLPSFDSTLQNFTSIVRFVRQNVLCNRPTCDLCDTNYVSERIYPPFTLQCSRCWPTRLAGLIRDSSPLKAVITEAAVELGNNRPPQTPPQFFNLFFANCLGDALGQNKNWISAVDFVIHHTSWFENSDVGSCRPRRPNLFQETRCFLQAYGYLISHVSPLLLESRRCVVKVSQQSDPQITPDIFRRYLRQSSRVITNPAIRSRKLNSPQCPRVSRERFLEVFMENVRNSTTEEDFISTDTTLDDFAFVIEQVMSSYKCIGPICDRCTLRYPYRVNSRYSLSCNRCWPTRLAGMIKDSSPLKIPATEAARAFIDV